MPFPSILYWKWDDSHLQSGKYAEQIADIVARSPFSHIYITTHWCHEGLTCPNTLAHLKNACDLLHTAGRKMILEVDVRAEKAAFAAKHPNDRAGFLYWKTLSVKDGCCSFTIRGNEGKELFGGDRQSGDALLGAIAYRTDDNGSVIDDSMYTVAVALSRTNSSTVTITWVPIDTDEQIFIAVWSIFDFPDLFSEAYYSEATHLMDLATTISPDGAALDELCFMWHPDFDFSVGSYMTMDDCPVYSQGFAEAYREQFGTDYVIDMLYRFVSAPGDPRRIAANNRYFRCLREGIAAAENNFYQQSKQYFGEDAFVGAHNTWFCIEEVQNSPEIWRTGITWWSAVKDYGFTDEIMLYPVRTALTHKASAPVFYNMWYSEATMQLSSFYTELWRNVRYGGRTISLSYECINESNIVQQLYRPGELEAIAAIEEEIQGVDAFIQSSARCDVAVVTSLAALCNRQENLDGNGRWDIFSGKLKEVFTLTRDLWIAGWNCDMIGDNEIYNHNLFINEDGYLAYGNQVYTCLILVYPQYAEPGLQDMIQQLVASGKTRLILVGKGNTNFEGLPMLTLEEVLSDAPHFSYRPEIGDITALLTNWGIQTNRIPCGCVMQDGSIIITASAPDKPTGNLLHSQFELNDSIITVDGIDVVCLRKEHGKITVWSPHPFCIKDNKL
ncbi:MAG: hypothetical protein PHH93_00020 [Prolixibacteraceae bacterium]|nr:hypothetical protein [Prolixibacteraceae bacterium]